jgi:hypothetical protein
MMTSQEVPPGLFATLQIPRLGKAPGSMTEICVIGPRGKGKRRFSLSEEPKVSARLLATLTKEDEEGLSSFLVMTEPAKGK